MDSGGIYRQRVERAFFAFVFAPSPSLTGHRWMRWEQLADFPNAVAVLKSEAEAE